MVSKGCPRMRREGAANRSEKPRVKKQIAADSLESLLLLGT